MGESHGWENLCLKDHTGMTRLEEIKARLKAATPGPWKECHHLQSLKKDASCPCGFAGDIWGGDQEHVVCSIGAHCGPEGSEMIPRYERATELDNAQFIAHSREDIEYLLDLVQRITDRINALPDRLTAE